VPQQDSISLAAAILKVFPLLPGLDYSG